MQPQSGTRVKGPAEQIVVSQLKWTLITIKLNSSEEGEGEEEKGDGERDKGEGEEEEKKSTNEKDKKKKQIKKKKKRKKNMKKKKKKKTNGTMGGKTGCIWRGPVSFYMPVLL